jgi:acetyltransferase-like isoleucine patch superfamily enzyme
MTATMSKAVRGLLPRGLKRAIRNVTGRLQMRRRVKKTRSTRGRRVVLRGSTIGNACRFDDGSRAIDSNFGDHVRLYAASLVSNSAIGSGSYVSPGSIVSDAEIGRFCSIGPGVRIGLGKHPSRDFVSTHPAFYSSKAQAGFSFCEKPLFLESERIIIGNDVWIGCNGVIRDGVRIGNGAIIGAGAVVTSDIDDYSIAGGVPARHIRFRFSQSEIEWLQRTRWWDLSFDEIRKRGSLFSDIRTLMEKWENP